jgi:hypothetical protein
MAKPITADAIDAIWAAREAESLTDSDREVLIALRDSAYFQYVMRKMQRWVDLGEDEFPMGCRVMSIQMDAFMTGVAWCQEQTLEDMFKAEGWNLK